MLPNVPDELVNQFWIVYRELHDERHSSSVGSHTFKQFYHQEGDWRHCLLCGHTLRNMTQMVQHLEGTHFELFKFECEVEGWQVLSRCGHLR